MSQDIDIDRFLKNPVLLIKLCREVIERIDGVPDKVKAAVKTTQLREIAKAVEKIEKAGVSVPNVLRAEKTRLAVELDSKAETKQTLQSLAEGLGEIVEDLNDRLGHDVKHISKPGKPRVKRSRTPKTDKKVLRKHIIKALRSLGGKAKVSEVIEEMGRQLEGKLLPGDREWRESTKEYAWQNNTKWERYSMTQDGTLRNDSPRGYWELGEEQR